MGHVAKLLICLLLLSAYKWLADGKVRRNVENETEPKSGFRCVVAGKRYRYMQKIKSRNVAKCGARCLCGKYGRINCIGPNCLNGWCVDGSFKYHRCCPLCPRGPNCWLGNKIIKANTYVVEHVGSGCTKLCKCPGRVAYFLFRTKTQAECKLRCTRNVE